MKPIALVLLWIFILAVILLSTPTSCPAADGENGVEGFYTYGGYYKRYCPSCGWRSRATCSKCTNCGFGLRSDGYGQCMPGDNAGPFHRDDVMYWEYGKQGLPLCTAIGA